MAALSALSIQDNQHLFIIIASSTTGTTREAPKSGSGNRVGRRFRIGLDGAVEGRLRAEAEARPAGHQRQVRRNGPESASGQQSRSGSFQMKVCQIKEEQPKLIE